MNYQCPPSFTMLWRDVPIVFIDFETTGLPPGGRAVEVGFARFERGQCVDEFSSFINPGEPIPADATAVHGITDDDVKDAPTVEQVFASARARALCEGAQPAAYNASFDRLFVPVTANVDHSWPWIDALVIARKVDRYVSGSGKHKLGATCERHGVKIDAAHRAGADARATGEVFHVLMQKKPANQLESYQLGDLLHWIRGEQNNEWHRFHTWLSQQPPMQQGCQ